MNLKVLYLRINNYCNVKCFMCDFWKFPLIDIEEDQFEKVLGMVDGLELIRFTGGEPLMCNKLPLYIQRCHEKRIKTSIVTNGLILNEKIENMVKCGLNQVVISVDGSTPELHDSLRGKPGLFAKIEKALDKISREYPMMRTRVNTVVSEKNIHDLPQLAIWLDKHNVEQWSIIPIKLDNYQWSERISFEDFKSRYIDFQKAAKNSNVTMMGYSASWAGNTTEFWSGKSFIRPTGACHLSRIMSFYDPFTDHFYPCNCIPHRKLSFNSYIEDALWYFKHGHEYCTGCEPLNAWCSDNPEKLDSDILNF